MANRLSVAERDGAHAMTMRHCLAQAVGNRRKLLASGGVCKAPDRRRGGWRASVVCVALAAILGGCANSSEISPSTTPQPTPLPYAPVSDQMTVRKVRQVLYYLSQDGAKLRPMLKTISVLPEETMLEALLGQLMQAPEDPSFAPIFPMGYNMYLLGVEQSQNVATVNLTGRFTMLDRAQQFAARAAIVNTLTELSDIRYVNILIDGKAVSPYMLENNSTIPFGTMSRVSEDIAEAFTQVESEYTRAKSQESLSETTINRQVTLYFASADGTMLMPEVREISMDCVDMIVPVVNALIRGPSDSAQFSRTLPAGLVLRSAGLRKQGGEMVVAVDLRAGAREMIARSGISPELLHASLLYTLCSFVPDVDGIQLIIDGNDAGILPKDAAQEEKIAARPEQTTTPTDEKGEGDLPELPEVLATIYRYEDFHIPIGRNVTLYYPMEDGRLRPALRTLSQLDAGSARSWLSELLIGASEQAAKDSELFSFPADFTAQEILGIALSGETALINLSGKAAHSLAGSEPVRERAWVYSLINTLSGVPGIRNVRFLVDGAPVDSFGGSISLREALLPNPGIVEK